MQLAAARIIERAMAEERPVGKRTEGAALVPCREAA
jgi:hypothetical protein